jgi:hypothetical protein
LRAPNWRQHRPLSRRITRARRRSPPHLQATISLLFSGHSKIKGRSTMSLPKFDAESSLFKSNVRYWSFVRATPGVGVAPQRLNFPIPPGPPFGWCGSCDWDNAGACVRTCGFCLSGPPIRCELRTELCDPSACPAPTPPPADCMQLKRNCTANGGTVFDCHDIVPDRCAACPPCCFRCM